MRFRATRFQRLRDCDEDEVTIVSSMLHAERARDDASEAAQFLSFLPKESEDDAEHEAIEACGSVVIRKLVTSRGAIASPSPRLVFVQLFGLRLSVFAEESALEAEKVHDVTASTVLNEALFLYTRKGRCLELQSQDRGVIDNLAHALNEALVQRFRAWDELHVRDRAAHLRRLVRAFVLQSEAAAVAQSQITESLRVVGLLHETRTPFAHLKSQMAGNLHMRTDDKWQKVACVLREGAFAWFASSHETVPRGVVHLRVADSASEGADLACASVTLDESRLHRGRCAFTVHTPLRQVSFRAAHEVALAQWVTALRQVSGTICDIDYDGTLREIRNMQDRRMACLGALMHSSIRGEFEDFLEQCLGAEMAHACVALYEQSESNHTLVEYAEFFDEQVIVDGADEEAAVGALRFVASDVLTNEFRRFRRVYESDEEDEEQHYGERSVPTTASAAEDMQDQSVVGASIQLLNTDGSVARHWLLWSNSAALEESFRPRDNKSKSSVSGARAKMWSLGRASGNSIRVSDNGISRHHARLELRCRHNGQSIVLSDLGSRAGTFLVTDTYATPNNSFGGGGASVIDLVHVAKREITERSLVEGDLLLAGESLFRYVLHRSGGCFGESSTPPNESQRSWRRLFRRKQ